MGCLPVVLFFFASTDYQGLVDTIVVDIVQSLEPQCSGWCAAGTSTNDAGTTCTQCALGQYQDQTNQISCSNCPNGYYQNELGSTSCKIGELSCNAGFFSDQTGCKSCPAGTYSSEVGLTSCPGRCPAGTYASEVGLSSSAECKGCPTGLYQGQAGGTVCDMCPNGYYQNELGSNSCKIGESPSSRSPSSRNEDEHNATTYAATVTSDGGFRGRWSVGVGLAGWCLAVVAFALQ